MTEPSGRSSSEFDSPDGANKTSRRTTSWSIMAFAGLVVVVFAFVRKGQIERNLTASWEVEFTAFAAATSLAVEEWMRDRVANMRVVSSAIAPFTAAADAGDPAGLERVAATLTTQARHQEYDALWVIGRDGDLVTSEGAPEPPPAAVQFARETMEARNVLRRGPVDLGAGPVIMLGAPLLTLEALQTGEPGDWAVVLPGDPEVYIMQALAAGTQPGRETERTGLVVSRADSVFILAPDDEGIGIVSGPMEVASEAVLLAAAGESRFGRFIDADTGPVLAITRPVEGTDFGLIRQISATEAFAPLTGQLLLELFGASTALALIGLGWSVRSRRLEMVALERAHTNLQMVVDNDPEAVVVFDVDAAQFVLANGQASDMFGFSPEQLLQLGPGDVSPPRQPDGRPSEAAAMAYIGQALRQGTATFAWTHQHRDGTPIPCEVYLSSLRTDRRLVRGSMVDLREPRWAETALRQSQVEAREREEFVTRVVTAMSDGLAVLDRDGVHVQVNDALCQMTRFSEEELIGVGPPHPYWSQEHRAEIGAALRRVL